MVEWFKQHAPIRMKLAVAFGIQNGLVWLCFGAGWLVFMSGLSRYGFLFVCAGAALASAGLGLWMRHVISGPYVTTVVRMEKLAAGDLTSPIEFISFRDCVGRMTKAMQTFRQITIDKIAGDEAARDAAHAAEQERVSLQAKAAAEQAEIVVGSIGRGLTQLALGNLTFRLNEPLPGAYEKLRNDFNEAIGKIHQTLSSIDKNSERVLASTSEITQASDDLSRRTGQQASTLEQTAAALNEITGKVRKTADDSTESSKLVMETKADAESSGVLVHETITAMSNIENSSKEINNIIGVIDEIAFQINLLALNAGIEAARAGDAGRGFAVVATEVRALAQRTTDAAKEIKNLIFTSNNLVDSGVVVVNKTGVALERIVGQVSKISQLVNDISLSAKEQANGLNELNHAVNLMDQVTQQNAAMVEEATAASHSLASEANELSRLVAQFKTGKTEASSPLSTTKPTPQPQPATARRRAAGASNVVALNQNGWDEF